MNFKPIKYVLMIIACVLIFNVKDSHADEDVNIDELQASINAKEDELDSLEAEKAKIEAGKSDIQKIVNGLKADKNEIVEVVTEMDEQLGIIQSNIDEYNTLIAEKEAQIEATTKELEAAVTTANEQYEAMKARIRFMYEQGETAYLEILLSAQSFSDLLCKADYIEKLSQYDRAKLEEYRLVIEYTEMCKEELEEEQEVLDEAMAAAVAEQDNMNALIDEKQVQIAAYEADISNQEEAIAEYDAELQEQTEIIEALEAQVAAEKAALDEATRVHYNGGVFTWPAPSYTRISDEYGWRIHPTLGVKKFHNGMDMASPGGSPILAAYDGKVVTAAYSSSAGNYIMIDHGDTLYTVYMHCSALYVSKGDTVVAGQQIGAVGSTGRSTGNHLHFGVRYNGEYCDPKNYL